MVRVRSIEGVLITADSFNELVKSVENELKVHEGYNPSSSFVDDKNAIVYFGEIPDEPEEPWSDRFCCECAEYDWGRGCPFREGRVTIMMNACHHFTVETRGDENE